MNSEEISNIKWRLQQLDVRRAELDADEKKYPPVNEYMLAELRRKVETLKRMLIDDHEELGAAVIMCSIEDLRRQYVNVMHDIIEALKK